MRAPQILNVTKEMARYDEKDDYERLKKELGGEIPPDMRMKANLILTKFGRKICRAENPSPRCWECPIERYCEE